ncbi:hypothetical protein V495_00343 [Pseudogymnoascus sp. VKM F-4514 (FW-929)]|nr:hypothetical protein V495_00343 [Pseudogymnoascus sp. VKM F-4514 (FW-929)]
MFQALYKNTPKRFTVQSFALVSGLNYAQPDFYPRVNGSRASSRTVPILITNPHYDGKADQLQTRNTLKFMLYGTGAGDTGTILAKPILSLHVMLVERDDVEAGSRDNCGRTPLSLTVENAHVAVVKLPVKLLIKRDDVVADLKDKDEESWLETVMKLLVEQDDIMADLKDKYYGRTALSSAAASGHKAVMKELWLECSPLRTNRRLHNVLNTYLYRRNVLRLGSSGMCWPAQLGREIAVQKFLEVKLLLEKSADVDPRDCRGRTPLSWAAWNGNEALVKLLLENGADVDSKNKENETALSTAVLFNYDAIVKVLVEKGADVDPKDRRGRTPLSWAAYNGNEALVELLLEKGADMDLKDGRGWTPLSWAACNGHEGLVKLLLKKGANVDLEDRCGRTPLSWAAWNGKEAFVKLLLEKGATVDSTDIMYDRTPLSWAAKGGHEAVVKLLLEKGANVETKDTCGHTPMALASSPMRTPVMELLLNHRRRSGGHHSQTPLSWAAGRGHEAVVNLVSWIQSGSRETM